MLVSTPSAASAAISSVSYPASRSISAVCSPTAGGADAWRARSPSNETGSAGSFRSGIEGWGIGCSIPSAWVCGAGRRRRRRRRAPPERRPRRGAPASRPCRGREVRYSRDRAELVAVGHAIAIRAEARDRRRARELEHVADRGEEPVVAAGDHQLAVPRREDLVRRDHREHGALTVRDRPVGQVADEVVADVAERRLVERRVDDAPTPVRSRSSSAATIPRRPTFPFPCR